MHMLPQREAMAMAATLRHQALILAAGNGVTRAMGFVLRLLTARWMGAEALGVMELAGTAGMLALTPLTAGLPSAMSRLTARRPAADQPEVLRAGLALARRTAMFLTLGLVLLSPALSWLMGDVRALPAMLAASPSVPLLGLCCVYAGYSYGRQDTLHPALNECAEQSVRFALTAGLILTLGGRSVRLTAALPALAESVAALASLLLFRRFIPARPSRARPSQALTRQLFRLAAPSTLSRLCGSGVRMLGAVLLPVCLRRSGLSAGAATAQYGLLSGMAMPLLMLPGVVTGALCMVATPAVSRTEGTGRLRGTMARLTLSALFVGFAAGAGLLVLAGPISTVLYHQSALAPLVRFLSPLTVLFALHQVEAGMIAGLGLQRRSLTGAILSGCIQLGLTACLAPLPAWRVFGAALAMMASHLFSVLWDGAVLLLALKAHTAPAG